MTPRENIRNKFTKSMVRMLLLSRAIEKYKRAAFDETCQLWQAGKGVDDIHAVESVEDVVQCLASIPQLK